MKVIAIKPRGFCPGVVKAIKIVEDVLQDKTYPRPIQILGMIVHNRHVVEDFSAQGVVTIDLPGKSRMEMLDSIVSGTVVITAHGVSDEVRNRLRGKDVIIVDATCKDVFRTQQLVRDRLEQGYQIFYIGKKGHPETESVQELSDRVSIIESATDLKQLQSSSEPIFVTNQTTYSIRDIESLIDEIRARFPNALISDEICDSTRVRQEAILRENVGVDVCFIVGDPRSNNTRNLARISEQETNTRTYLIETVDDIKAEMLQGAKVVSVSSGASTPNRITRKVIEFLESYQGS